MAIQDYTIEKLLDLDETIAAPYLKEYTYPWELLPHIGEIILSIGQTLPAERYERRDGDIWIALSARVAASADITGPCIIGEDAQIRQCAFIRGSALVGKGSVVGNSCELKNVILFNHCEVPHYNYVGDSVLGFHAHMGAGAITSNIKSDRTNVVIHDGGESIATGLRKMGAVLGDWTEIGCNTVLNPGTVIGRRSSVYPLSMIRGCVPQDHIYKDREHIVRRQSMA